MFFCLPGWGIIHFRFSHLLLKELGNSISQGENLHFGGWKSISIPLNCVSFTAIFEKLVGKNNPELLQHRQVEYYYDARSNHIISSKVTALFFCEVLSLRFVASNDGFEVWQGFSLSVLTLCKFVILTVLTHRGIRVYAMNRRVPFTYFSELWQRRSARRVASDHRRHHNQSCTRPHQEILHM